MALFDSFGKPGWESPKAEVRKAAVPEIEDREVLVRLVREDPELEVRQLALARIEDDGILAELCDALSGDLLNQARGQRLGKLLPGSGGLEGLDDSRLSAIASLSDDPDQIEDAVARIGDKTVRMDLATNNPVARVRLAAARGIEDPEKLHELMVAARHKDKSVYRHCKERLDVINAAEREAKERQARLVQLAEDAASLARGVDSPEYRARYQTLQHRWTELREHADERLGKAIETDLGVAEKRLETLALSQAEEEQRRAQIEAAQQVFGEVIAELEQIDPQEVNLDSAEALTQLQECLNGLEDRWLQALPHAQPSPDQFEACKERLAFWRETARTVQQLFDRRPAVKDLMERASHLDASDFQEIQKLEKRTAKMLHKLPWPKVLENRMPPEIGEVRQLRERLVKDLERLKEKQERNLEQLEAAFQHFREELETNHFNNADRSLNKLRNILRRIEPRRQQHYQDELKPLLARLREIHDWQGFAIEPKKQELIEQMRALVGLGIDPDELAGKIKALQDQWKSLGHLSPRRDQALWKQFSAAADEAYEPCRQAFAAQAQQRRKNFEARMELINQLRDYEQRMHWPDSPDTPPGSPPPDWKMVQKTLDTARAAFAAIQPVDRKGERKSRKALKKVGDRIYAHIKKEYDRNIELKKELVDRARALAEQEDLKEAINAAKTIQREWKDVGITPRQVDRRLWKELRKACDAVFARLDARREERESAKREQREAAEARKRKERERWPRLVDRMRACALKADDPDKAAELWNKEGDIPKGIDSAALAAWWEQGPADDVAEDQLREACIALEVFAGVDSPPEDKQARMAYQMQRLVEGMGSGEADGTRRLLELVNQFIAMRPPAQWMTRCDNILKGQLPVA